MRQLTTHNAQDYSPSWSPDGRKIAFFSSDRSGYVDIWVMDADGDNQQKLTTHNADDYSPSWSPDGRKIAFSSKRSGNYDVWIMDADGSHKRQITTHKIADIYPCWSPDGRKIAFASGPDIWVMDADGGNKRQLTTNEAFDWHPSWSPDGREIAITSKRSGDLDIWVLDVKAVLQQIASILKRSAPLRIASRERAATIMSPGKLRTTVLNTAVVEFQEKGSLSIQDAGYVIAEWMSGSLHKTQVFDIYERVLSYEVLEEQDLGFTGALDEKTTAEIGMIYGVEAIVTGTVSKFGNTISVVAKLIDTETAKVIASSDVKTTSVDEIPSAMDELAWELAKEP